MFNHQMRFKLLALGPLFISLTVGAVSAIGLDMLAPAIVQAEADPLAEAERLLAEGHLLFTEFTEEDALFEAGDESGGDETASDGFKKWMNALEKYEEALSLFRQGSYSPEERFRQRTGEGKALAHIGNIHFQLGNYSQSLDYYEQSLAITREIGDSPEERFHQRALEGETLGNIGEIHMRQGNFPQALEHYQQSLAVIQGIGDSPEARLRQRAAKISALYNISNVYLAEQNYPRALDSFQQILVITREISDSPEERLRQRNREVRALFFIGVLFHEKEQFGLAAEHLEAAIAAYESIPSDQQALETFTRLYQALALAYEGLGQTSAAQEIWDLLE